MQLFCCFNFEMNYDVLKSKGLCLMLSKNINFNKNQLESKMENPPHTFREMNLVLRLVQEPQVKSENLMSWSQRKKKEGIFCTVYLVTFVFYLNVQCIEYTFRKYILLHIQKYYLIHFCCLFLKSSKAFSVSLRTILSVL